MALQSVSHSQKNHPEREPNEEPNIRGYSPNLLDSLKSPRPSRDNPAEKTVLPPSFMQNSQRASSLSPLSSPEPCMTGSRSAPLLQDLTKTARPPLPRQTSWDDTMSISGQQPAEFEAETEISPTLLPRDAVPLDDQRPAPANQTTTVSAPAGKGTLEQLARKFSKSVEGVLSAVGDQNARLKEGFGRLIAPSSSSSSSSQVERPIFRPHPDLNASIASVKSRAKVSGILGLSPPSDPQAGAAQDVDDFRMEDDNKPTPENEGAYAYLTGDSGLAVMNWGQVARSFEGSELSAELSDIFLDKERLCFEMLVSGLVNILSQDYGLELTEDLEIIHQRRAIGVARDCRSNITRYVILKIFFLMPRRDEWMYAWIQHEVDALRLVNSEMEGQCDEDEAGACGHRRDSHTIKLFEDIHYNIPEHKELLLSRGHFACLVFDRGLMDLEEYMARLHEEASEEQKIVLRSREFSLNLAQKVLMCVLEGLAQCHKRDLIHGDIKPSNIVLRTSKHNQAANVWDLSLDDITFVLIDFDFAFVREKRADWNISSAEEVIATGIPRGTDGFFPPEMLCIHSHCANAHTDHSHIHDDYDFELGFAVDFWSFGLLLYYMVEIGPKLGECPFAPQYDLPFGVSCTQEGYECLKFLHGLFMEAYGPSGVPEELQGESMASPMNAAQDLMRWCLSWNPRNRPQNVEAILAHPFFSMDFSGDESLREPIDPTKCFCLMYSLQLPQYEESWMMSNGFGDPFAIGGHEGDVFLEAPYDIEFEPPIDNPYPPMISPFDDNLAGYSPHEADVAMGHSDLSVFPQGDLIPGGPLSGFTPRQVEPPSEISLSEIDRASGAFAAFPRVPSSQSLLRSLSGEDVSPFILANSNPAPPPPPPPPPPLATCITPLVYPESVDEEWKTSEGEANSSDSDGGEDYDFDMELLSPFGGGDETKSDGDEPLRLPEATRHETEARNASASNESSDVNRTEEDTMEYPRRLTLESLRFEDVEFAHPHLKEHSQSSTLFTPSELSPARTPSAAYQLSPALWGPRSAMSPSASVPRTPTRSPFRQLSNIAVRRCVSAPQLGALARFNEETKHEGDVARVGSRSGTFVFPTTEEFGVRRTVPRALSHGIYFATREMEDLSENGEMNWESDLDEENFVMRGLPGYSQSLPTGRMLRMEEEFRTVEESKLEPQSRIEFGQYSHEISDDGGLYLESLPERPAAPSPHDNADLMFHPTAEAVEDVEDVKGAPDVMQRATVFSVVAQNGSCHLRSVNTDFVNEKMKRLFL